MRALKVFGPVKTDSSAVSLLVRFIWADVNPSGETRMRINLCGMNVVQTKVQRAA